MANESEGSISQQHLVFGILRLSQEYEVEIYVAMSLVALLSFISVIANGILLLVIIKDPFNRLKTITAILLAFNSAANLGSSIVLFLDNVLFWRNKMISPELIINIVSFTTCLYVVGNLLHTLNTYCAVVVPVSYAALAPKVRKHLAVSLLFIWVVILLIVIVPPYTIPYDKRASYAEGTLTFMCVLLALLVVTFGYLYAKLFRNLYARKTNLGLSHHLRRATVRGRLMEKRDRNAVKTLFAQVMFFMIASVSGSVTGLVLLHCGKCDRVKMHLVVLFTTPITYSAVAFLPLLWLIRLENYKLAMIKILSFWRKSTCKTQEGEESLPYLVGHPRGC